MADTLQIIQNRDWIDYLNLFFQFLMVVITGFAANGIRNMIPKKEKVDGEFRFEPENNIIHMGLHNKCKYDIFFDFQKGVCIRWEDKKYHKINITDDSVPAFIPPKGGTQLKYSINLNIILKNIIKSKRFKVFIYTTRGKIFELHPSACQLKEWGITIEQYKELVKDL